MDPVEMKVCQASKPGVLLSYNMAHYNEEEQPAELVEPPHEVAQVQEMYLVCVDRMAGLRSPALIEQRGLTRHDHDAHWITVIHLEEAALLVAALRLYVV